MMVLLSLFGCFRVTRMPACEELGRTELSDGEQTLIGSPMEVLDRVLIDQTLSGEWPDGLAVDTLLRIERAGGATWVERRGVDIERRGLGFGGQDFDIYVPCPAYMELPLELSLQAESLDLELDAAVYQNEDTPLEYGVEVLAVGVFTNGDFPQGSLDPGAYWNKESQVRVRFEDEQVDGEAGWTGLDTSGERDLPVYEEALVFEGGVE